MTVLRNSHLYRVGSTVYFDEDIVEQEEYVNEWLIYSLIIQNFVIDISL